jgi:hypothetical protein
MNVQEFARLGGQARAKNMTKEERRASAQKASRARWAKLREMSSELVKLEKNEELAEKRTKVKKSGK